MIPIHQLENHPISKLIVQSLTCSLYQAFVDINGEEQLVTDRKGKPLRGTSIAKLVKQLPDSNIEKAVLRHECPYDEVIGLPSSTVSNCIEVPLGLNNYR